MNRHRLRDINCMLLIVVVVLAALLVYQIFKPLDLPEMVEGATSEGIAAIPSLNVDKEEDWTRLNYDSIVDLNLFSSERKPPSERSQAVAQEDGEGSAAYEGYELIGTVVSDEERSFALIRKGGVRGETKSYRVRETVGGMEIQDILYDRVILSKNGKEIVLLLRPREEEKKASIPPPKKGIERRKSNRETAPSGQQSWTPKQRKDQ